MKREGSCHCGNIRYELIWPVETNELRVRVCDCTFCTRHGGTYTSHPEAELRASFGVAEEVSAYRFGTRTATFHVCRVCGVVPFVTSDVGGRCYAVVNVLSLVPDPARKFVYATGSFGEESQEERLARRAKTWISKVDIDGK